MNGKLVRISLGQCPIRNLNEFNSKSIWNLLGISRWNPEGINCDIFGTLVWRALSQFSYTILREPLSTSIGNGPLPHGILKECLSKSIWKLVCWALRQFPHIILKGVLSKSIEQVFGNSKWNPLGVPYKSLGNWSGALNFHMESSRNSFQNQ